jgi:ABC-2 type transport system ATP-binding protein
VVSAAQIGNTLRVLLAGGGVHPDEGTTRIIHALRDGGVQANVTHTEPNLEDVFVASTQRAPSHEAAA